jgi:signal transduction histidine kinase
LKFISLKTKITILTVLLSVGTTAILGGYLVFSSYQSLRVQAEQAQLTLAKTLAWQVDQSLARAFQAVEALSKKPEVVQMNPHEAVGEMDLVTYATELIDGFLLFTPTGKFLIQSHPPMAVKDLPSHTFFVKNIKKSDELRKGVLVDVYKTSANQVGILISSPIFHSSKLVGILVGVAYLPNHNIENLENARFGKTGYAFLVNQQGLAVVHPDKTRLLDSMLGSPAVQMLQKKKDGVIQFRNNENEEVLAAYSAVESASWGVVVRQTAEECYKPAAHMLQLMILFLLVVFVAGIFAALALSEKVVRPILNLVTQVEQYEKGHMDFKDPASIQPKDEVEVLAQALGRMAQKLRKQTRGREKAYQQTLKTERKLAESERLATIGQFSAGLAHELNNPLTVILGSARMAQTSTGNKLKNWLNAIDQEANRCRRLVSDLLTFAKPIELQLQKFDIILLIQECWIQIPEDSDKFKLKCQVKSFLVKADRDRIKQVLVNILRNATEAMPDGGEIEILLRREKTKYQISLGDQGMGVHKKDLSHLFHPFFTTKSAGTGLGLVIARSILQAHGGRIRLESRKPHGTWIRMEWLDL